MAKLIADSYMGGMGGVVSQVKGFQEAREVFNRLKEASGLQLAAEFFDRWSYYQYTGRVMQD